MRAACKLATQDEEELARTLVTSDSWVRGRGERERLGVSGGSGRKWGWEWEGK